MFTVSRRTLVTGGGGAVLAELLRSDPASAITEEGDSPSPTVANLLTQSMECYSEDFGAAFTADWSAVVELGAATLVPAGTRAVVEFDDRFFAAGKATLFSGGAVRSVSTTTTNSGFGRTQVSFEIDRAFGDTETVGIGLPLTSRPLYPSENIGTFSPAVLTLTAPSRTTPETFDLLGTALERPVAPWGVDVSGAWSTTDVREGAKTRTYRSPSLVRVASVGPQPAPAGAVSVTVDANLVREIAIEAVSLDSAPLDMARVHIQTTRVSNELRVNVAPGVEIPAGSVLEVLAEPLAHGERPTVPEGLVFARAEFVTDPSADRPRRLTGRSTFIDVTESGTVEQSDAAKGSI